MCFRKSRYVEENIEGSAWPRLRDLFYRETEATSCRSPSRSKTTSP